MKAAAASEEPVKGFEESNAVAEGEDEDETADGDDDGGDDGTDDENEMAGDEPDLEATGSGNACVDQPGWDRDFSSRMYKCAMKTGVDEHKAGKCMAEKQGVSHECGRCMGKLMKCSVKCASQCCSGRCMKKGKCKRCVSRRCAWKFKRCAGVDAP